AHIESIYWYYPHQAIRLPRWLPYLPRVTIQQESSLARQSLARAHTLLFPAHNTSHGIQISPLPAVELPYSLVTSSLAMMMVFLLSHGISQKRLWMQP